jgi:integrase/recombinase XerD
VSRQTKSHGVTLTQAIEGYLIAAHARRLSEETLSHYAHTHRRLLAFLQADPPLASIDAGAIRGFLASLTGIGAKSIRNHHTGLAALWTWAVHEGLVDRHVIHDVAAPSYPHREIIPYSHEDLRAMLRACERTVSYTRPGKRPCDNARPTALRDRAIILLLLDTGIRASELCNLRMLTCDLKNSRITVTGKGRRERTVPISPRTAQALWRYLAGRADRDSPLAPLFLSHAHLPFTRDVLHKLLSRIGSRAGLQGVNLHRFRHTCAIQALRNGMNVFALQRLLGHSTLDMVRRYLAIAETDVERAHRDASPVMNWVL